MCQIYPQYIFDMWHSSFTQVQSCSQGKYTGSFSGGQVSIIAHLFTIYVCIIGHIITIRHRFQDAMRIGGYLRDIQPRKQF